MTRLRSQCACPRVIVGFSNNTELPGFPARALPFEDFLMKFEGTQSYVATDDLKLAVNAAIT
ncbi:hypothetical protein, partial [Pseudomonas aeruginosa]|uniref:hypothetical protein n=1 Tax=Pseudomonas aeruginosa TaxID=287 RepID=UPI0019698963